MSELASIRATCTPRSDVLAGGLVDKHFAAQLDQVVRRAAGYEAYADAERFFELTFPTKGLRDLLSGTFARLSGRADVTPSAEHAVYRYETSFGGGKTHGLIALWHLAAGARPANVAEFVAPDLLPPVCSAAAVVGDALDPVNGLRGDDGVTTWTLWGEIARQLGPAAWELVAASDEARTSCGKQVWLDVFGGTPTVIVIDEIAQYLRRLGTSGDEQVRNLAGATIDGLKVLFEAATAAPAVRIVFTLATGTAAFGTETADVARTLRDVEAQRLQREAADVMQRPMGAVGRPADDNEIGYILRRRLFADVDDAAANDAAAAYRALYGDLANRGVSVGAATDDPAAFSDRIATAYPFHPALIECLDKRIGPLPGFQRARGALKMLAESVATLWSTGVDPPILNLGDLPLEDTQVRASVTSSIGREALDGPAVADFAGPSSHAAATDDDRWPKRRMATRSCRTVFLHSVAGEPAPGATEPDIYAGTLRPGEDPEVVDEALAATSRVAWHLVSDGARWRLQIAPNANRIIAAEVDNVPNTDVSEKLNGHIRRIFPTDGPVETVHAPASPADVPDQARLRLAVFSHVDVTTTAGKVPDAVVTVARYAGAAEDKRTFRNSVVGLVADADATERMRRMLRFELAADRIVSDTERMSQFDSAVARTLKRLADSAWLETRVAICRAYRHLFWPARDPGHQDLRHFELPPREQGAVKSPQTGIVVEALRTHGKITDLSPPTDRLAKTSGFDKAGEATTADVAQAPWRDHSQPIPINPTRINDAIVAGVGNGTWVYYDADRERAYTAASPPPAVRIASDAWLYSPERAHELGLLRKPVTLALISGALNGTEGGTISGSQLRGTLETAIGGEPTKKEVLEVLAANAQTGENLVVVEPPAGTGSPPLTPAAIRRTRLDDLVVLSPAAAGALGISGPDPSTLRVEGRGSVGHALQQVDDQIADLGAGLVISITVTATAGSGERARDLRLLGFCIPQLPRFDSSIRLKVAVEYEGLHGGVRVELSGGASDYQRIEELLLRAVDAGNKMSASLGVEFTPGTPIAHGAGDWEQLHNVLTTNNPGRVVIEARLARASD